MHRYELFQTNQTKLKSESEIVISAFQEKVSSISSFYLANMHSNVSQ